MTTLIILLWITVAFEFFLILGLIKKCENEKRNNENIRMMVRQINVFLDSYTKENQKTHDKTISVLEEIANKIVKMENGN